MTIVYLLLSDVYLELLPDDITTTPKLASYPGSLIKGGGGKESLVHTVCACVKLCTRLARAMTFYDVLVTFDRVLTSALIDF